MSKNTVDEKAARYLTEGKIKVVSHNAELAVLRAYGSSSTPYMVIFSAAGWECSCPAHTECAHIVAAKLISPLRPPEHVSLGADTTLTQFLDSL